jgi:hypothetical protein
MPHYGYDDACMTKGLMFRLGRKRKSGLFGLLDGPPPIDGSTVESRHIRNRKLWKRGMAVTQIGWSRHGQVAVVETEAGIELAVWCSEMDADPRQREILHEKAALEDILPQTSKLKPSVDPDQ